MRRILCVKCGKPRPTPNEDLARGLDVRTTRGVLSRSVYCDTCARLLNPGDQAVALTQPARIGIWEHEYFEIPAEA